MKYLLSIITAVLITVSISAQQHFQKISPELAEILSQENQQTELLVWVFFTDKKTDTDAVLKPEEVISVRSIERRQLRSSMNGIINYHDLPVSVAYMQTLADEVGITVKQKSRWFNGISTTISEDQLQQIIQLPFVKEVDMVAKYKIRYPEVDILSESVVRNNNNSSQYTFDYGGATEQVELINVPEVHELGITGEGIVIGVLDTEFMQLTHEVFENLDLIAQWDFVNNDADATDGYHPHGTSTLSLIGAFKDSTMIGTAFGASFIVAKTEDVRSETPVEEDNWIAAIEWMDSIGVDVASTSLGYIDFDAPYDSYTWESMDGQTANITIAADLAVERGIVVFTSAGNEGYHSTHNTLGAPADGFNVITVGAVTSSGGRSGFSSVGPTADGRTKPDIMAQGSNCFVASVGSDQRYSIGSGTSYSCPLSAGVGALLLQKHPEWTPADVLEALRQSGNFSSSPNNEYGWGIIDAVRAMNHESAVDVNDNKNVPLSFTMHQNFPNPFNPVTTISFELAETADCNIVIYNVMGETVMKLVNQTLQAGTHAVHFDGSELSSGIYFARINANNYSSIIKMTLMK